jgi:decaprenyl-phosphate phosphoribosyltransferase
MAQTSNELVSTPIAVAANVRSPARARAGALARTVRPRQMPKNLLVPAAPFVAGVILDPLVALHAVVAMLSFALAAAGTYLLNDVIDAPVDSAHPRKCRRPIAAGELSPQLALTASVVLLGLAVLTALPVSVELGGVLAAYVVIQVSYCTWLRRQPVLDICCVASGFVLRVVAGAVATSVVPSVWFLTATAFGSLFVVSGRRHAELRVNEQTGMAWRPTLDRYSMSYLRFVWSCAATMLILGYLMWSFSTLRSAPFWGAVALIPFVMAVLRYALDVDAGRAGAPEEIALRDRLLQTLGAVWFVAATIAIYA